jgi:hypothetical protein
MPANTPGKTNFPPEGQFATPLSKMKHRAKA